MQNNEIENILNMFNDELITVSNLTELNNINSKYIGKNGKINILFKNINHSNKIEILSILNNAKKNIFNLIKLKKIELKNIEDKYKIDVTAPIANTEFGSYHIINSILMDIHSFFLKNGFSIEKGQELDNCYYNFDALNMPIDHPSRSLNDTFYINDNLLLRTHTSNMQIHMMEKNIPPIKVLSYGKVYRRDDDISHTPMFHQVEGFLVDVNLSLSNLKFILFEFLNFFFSNSVVIKFRSSYFPFTEPSFEVDIKCVHCLGIGCKICKNSGWIEILGCGMINPFILNTCNIDPNIYNGFAFGIGVERLAMIKYKINDIKLFFENNLDFLSQF